jgi:15-cis-phytoene synthase
MGNGGTSSDDLDYLAALVRTTDRPRYYAALFAPAALRPDLLALYGFAAEIARIPDQVSEGGLGEIRLRWWADSLAEAAVLEDQGNAPAVRGLSRAIRRYSLPLAPFEALAEARALDFHSDPPPTLADLEGRLGETESALFQMAALMAGAASRDTSDAAGHAGVAYGLAHRLANFAGDRAKGRTILPAELLSDEGLSAADVFLPAAPPSLEKVIAELGHIGRGHLHLAQDAIAKLPSSIRQVFLPLAVVRPLLTRIDALGSRIMHEPVVLSDLGMLTAIGLTRTFGSWRDRKQLSR